MFEGSEHYPSSYFGPLQQAGALLNGSTNSDRTNYWEVVPTGALELALFLESDRMGHLLPALTEEKFQNQRDVVLNERRQNYENRPYGLAGLALSTRLFHPNHPYHWPTIGWPDDLKAATLEDVRAFFRTYYHPSNASLVLAGDIDPDRAFELAERYFGDLAPGPVPARVEAHAEPTEPRRDLMEDRVELPRLYMAWHSPGAFEDGDADLDLAGDVIGHGKTSRLYRSLVFEKRIATDVSAYQYSRELGGMFQIAATAVPGVALGELERVILDTVQEVATRGPDADEVERAVVSTDAQFIYRLQTVGGFGGKSDQLNYYNVYCGDPGYSAKDRARYDAATPASTASAVGRWLTDAPRVTLSVVPRDRRDLAAPDSAEVSVV
jgi:zinc protease